MLLPGEPEGRRDNGGIGEDITENNAANAIKMKALSLLHEEAMKSFARGSKAAADFIDAYSRRVVKE